MKTQENPFTLSFGREPNTIISRHESIQSILDTFRAENPTSQTYLIEGIRGSGKTVLMTTVSRQLSNDDNWIVVHLNSAMDLMSDFAFRLGDACQKTPRLLKKGFQISVAGVGFGVSAEPPVQDYVGMIETLLKQVKQKGKRVLITIDEVQPGQNMRVFASQFQIFLRSEYPVFLIMTGLYEKIHAVQNDPALTFLLRAPKIRTEPLSGFQIRQQYKKALGTDDETTAKLADATKGYAFAFQALGAVYWEHRHKPDMKQIFMLFDEMLDDFVYQKIWEGLTDRERDIVLVMDDKEHKVKNICEKTSMSSGTFSKYRDSLIHKGLMRSTSHGSVALTLPHFSAIVKNYTTG